MHQLITALIPGSFADSLCKKSTKDLDELRQHSTKFMQMEELREFRNQVRVDVGSEKKINERERGYQNRRAKEEITSIQLGEDEKQCTYVGEAC